LPNKLNALTGTASYGSWFNFYLCDFDGRIVLPKTKQVLSPDMHVARARCGS
ncbi:MCE family protein, partial [Streptomyces sp. NPDC001139]